MDYRCSADVFDSNSLHIDLHDAIRAATDCLPFFETSPRPADDAVQSDAHWPVCDHDFLSDAADWRGDLQGFRGSDARGKDHSRRCIGSGRNSDAAIHVALHSRKGCRAFP